jgi:hypothetical protein
MERPLFPAETHLFETMARQGKLRFPARQPRLQMLEEERSIIFPRSTKSNCPSSGAAWGARVSTGPTDRMFIACQSR